MENLKEIIYKLETDLLKPEIRSSIEKLGDLLADDFIEYGSSGLIYDKDTILKRLPKEIPPSYFLYDFEIFVLSGNIIQTRFKTDKINLDNTKTVSLRNSLWRKNGDIWQIFFHQGTPVK
jgi:hypothetical protein